MQKKGLEFGFTWLFALLAGGVILFITIFAAMRLVDTGQLEKDSEIAAQLTGFLNPLETNLETGRYYGLSLQEPLRIRVSCETTAPFGRDALSISTRGVSGAWSREGIASESSSKYVFTEPNLEGSQMHILSIPFAFPYEIGSILTLSSSNYCFLGAPQEVSSFVERLGPKNMNVSLSKARCPQNSITVCFGNAGCNISVAMNFDGKGGTVTKGREMVYFYDSLLYAAIIADPIQYTCEVTRLRMRASQLSDLYLKKAELLSRNCPSNLETDVYFFGKQLSNRNVSLSSLEPVMEDLKRKNELLNCPLF